jgi:hypothetical protein
MKKIYILLSFCLIQFIAQAQTIPAYVPTNGLVGWWPFNGNANDESGNGNNGTVNGATLTTDRFGLTSKCYEFNGSTQPGSNNTVILTDNVIDIPGFNAAFTNEITISVWANVYTSNNSEFLQRRTNNNIDFAVGCSAGLPGLHFGNVGNFNSSTSISYNSWHHYVYLYDGSLMKIYLDGNLISQQAGTGQMNNNATIMNLGKYIYFGMFTHYFFYNGKLDDIAIWNRALTQQEITTLYILCQLSISSQPTNQSTTTGSNASFNVGVTTDCNNPTSYQWQTNTGFGWQTLQNAGQYTGVNTSTLNVSNVNLANTNQLFRCIVSTGNLTDTTQTATLTVVNTNNTNHSGVTHAIPYQAVVRDGAGNPLINHPLTVRCTLHDNTASGTSIYQETHTITTNNLGLFTLHIGTGVASIGNIDSIHWALYKKYLQVEFDTTAQGVSYIDLGTQQLMAVPYALYAETAGNALNAPKGDNGVDGVNGINGVNGVNGVNGSNGADGISVTSATITNDSLYLSLSNSQTLNAGKLSGGLPNGTTAGEMMYWNGTAWVSVAPTTSLPGNQSKTLRFCNGVPTWEDCPAVLPTLITTAISDITNATANCGGYISSDGGAGVTDRGICWSTSSNPTIALSTKTIDGNGIGSFTSSLTGMLAGSTYYVRAYATNSVGTTYGNEVIFTTNLIIAIGQSYQGGVIAYLLQQGDSGYDANVPHGLIAAPYDQSSGIQWYFGSNLITGATATILSTGNANTNSIVSSQGNGIYAAKICYDLVLNGYNDWYLPSKDELNKIYLNKTTIGSFGSFNYWSSSEDNSGVAWYQNFLYGYQSTNDKNYTYYVRAVRSF